MALYNQAQTILFNDAAMLPLRFGADDLRGPAVRRRLIATGTDAQLPGDLFYETIQIKKH